MSFGKVIGSSVQMSIRLACRRVAPVAVGMVAPRVTLLSRGTVQPFGVVAGVRGFASDGSHPDFEPESKVNASDDLMKFLDQAVKEHDVLLFMKGVPEAPRCGFSAKVTAILKENGVNFSSADVLASDEIREGAKVYSKWPTFPQLYVNGEFVGGCDIVTEMHESGELAELLEDIKAKQQAEKAQ